MYKSKLWGQCSNYLSLFSWELFWNLLIIKNGSLQIISFEWIMGVVFKLRRSVLPPQLVASENG